MWLIEMKGESFDLEEFPRNFPSGPIHATIEDGRTYITGPHFDQFSDPRDVLREAAAIAESWTGVVSLAAPSIRMPGLGGLRRREQGKPDTQYVLVDGIEVRSKVSSAVTVTVDGKTQQSGLTRGQDLQNVADASPHLKAALRLWAREDKSWGDLYRITEELQGHVGQDLSKADHCSANQLARFTQCCQSHDVAGLDARHRIGYNKPPRNPMSLDEAKEFVRGIFQSVVSRRAP